MTGSTPEILDTDPQILSRATVLSPRSLRLHATCIRAFNKGMLFVGPSGSGKSDLALQLLGYGAQLVADDVTILSEHHDQVIASSPEETLGLIEARGVGLLKASMAPRVAVTCLVDLGQTEIQRLPEPKFTSVLGQSLRVFHKPEKGSFAAALLQYLRAGESQT